MSVSGELLCSFELLKPLDSSALKSHIKKGRNKRQNMLNSPVRGLLKGFCDETDDSAARESISSELLRCSPNRSLGRSVEGNSLPPEDIWQKRRVYIHVQPPRFYCLSKR